MKYLKRKIENCLASALFGTQSMVSTVGLLVFSHEFTNYFFSNLCYYSFELIRIILDKVFKKKIREFVAIYFVSTLFEDIANGFNHWKAMYEKQKAEHFCSTFVGVAGFEPAASCSQSRRDNRATLHPVA